MAQAIGDLRMYLRVHDTLQQLTMIDEKDVPKKYHK